MAKTDVKIENVVKYYYDYGIFKTHFLNALSATFKEGESFFMKSITAYLKEYPEYRQRIIQFCNEERTHTIWHITMNNLLDGVNNNTALKDLEESTGRGLRLLNFLPKDYKLLVTECLEHITYCLCKSAIESGEFEKLLGDSKNVFLQHSIEETGLSHSTIAGDLYKKVGNKYVRRVAIYLVFTALTYVILKYINYLYDQNDDFSGEDLITGLTQLSADDSWLRTAIKDVFKTW